MKKIYIVGILLSIFTFSCVKDNTNTTFKEINEIKIDSLSSSYEIVRGEDLIIYPYIESSIGDTVNIDYMWYIYGVDVVDTVSFERNLCYNTLDLAPGNKHTLALRATDRASSTYTIATMSVTTTSIYYNGIVALGTKDGNMDLTFISNYTSTDEDGNEYYSFYEDAYSKENDGAYLSADSYKLYYSNYYPSNLDGGHSIMVMAKNATGGEYLHGNTLVSTDYMCDKYITPIEDDVLEISYHSGRMYTDETIVNGQLYPRSQSTEEKVSWLDVVWNILEPNDYSLSSCAFICSDYPFSCYPIFYDNLNNRLMSFQGLGTFSTFNIGIEVGESLFTYDDFGDNMEMLINGSNNTSGTENWALMKNTVTNKLYIYEFTLSRDPSLSWTGYFAANNIIEIDDATCDNILNAKALESCKIMAVSWISASISGENNLFVYIANNKLYGYNIDTESEIVLLDGAAEGYELDCVTVSPMQETNADYSINSYTRLLIGLRDNNESGLKGKIISRKISTYGGLNITEELYKSKGFCDQIVSLVNKPI